MRRIAIVLALILAFAWGLAAGRYDVFPGALLKLAQDRMSPDGPQSDKPGTLLDGEADSWLIGQVNTVMLGDSITQRGRWEEMFPGQRIANRGIGADMVTGAHRRLPTILALKPKKLFLMIGVNDIINGWDAETVAAGYGKLLGEAKGPKLYVQSVFLCGPRFCDDGKRQEVVKLNQALKALAARHGATFIDVAPAFSRDGVMRDDLSIDGLHLNGAGYQLWRDLLRPYVEAP